MSKTSNNLKYWDHLKEFGIAGLSAATGDPEAIKTIVEILANATHTGLEKINVKGSRPETIKKHLQKAVDSGADGLVGALDWYQKKAAESNENLRKKYGRQH